MAVLFSQGSQARTAQTQTFDFTVAAGATQITVTLTHGDWPEGECIRAELLWDKSGTPTGGSTVTTRTAAKPPGVTDGQVRVQWGAGADDGRAGRELLTWR